MNAKPALMLAGFVVFCLLGSFEFSDPPQPAQAHLAYKPKAKTLKARARTQARNLKHARYVASYGAGRNRTWHRKARRWLAAELQQTRNLILLRSLASPHAAICHVFGGYCGQAIAVASCETGGTFSVWATNGQYLGLFQMGASERARYGHGSTPLEQARAAWRYFAASGFDWSPWACKP